MLCWTRFGRMVEQHEETNKRVFPPIACTQDVAKSWYVDSDGLPFEGEILSRSRHHGHQMDESASNRMPVR